MAKKYENINLDEIAIGAIEEIVNISNKKELTEEDIDILIADLYHIAGDYMATQLDDYNGYKVDGYIRTTGTFKTCAKFLMSNNYIKDEKEVLLSNKDLANPKIKTDTKVEVYANIAYFANVAAHIIDKNGGNNDLKKLLSEIGLAVTPCVKVMYSLKCRFMNELIKCKENGEMVDISFEEDTRGRNIFYACIPGYFEPFAFHGIKQADIPDDMIEKYSKNNSELLQYYTIYPVKIKPAMEENLRKIYEELKLNPDNKELAGVKSRILWYFETQERFKQMEKPQEKQIEGPRKEKGKFVATGDKVATTYEANKEFFELINEDIGGILSKTTIEGLLERTSYSVEELYKKLKETIELKLSEAGVTDERIDIESKKVLLYIKMDTRKKPSTLFIYKKPQEQAVTEAVQEYQKAMQFLEEYNGQDTSYKELQKEMQKYVSKDENPQKPEAETKQTYSEVENDSKESIIRQITENNAMIESLTADIDAGMTLIAEQQAELKMYLEKVRQYQKDNNELLKRLQPNGKGEKDGK